MVWLCSATCEALSGPQGLLCEGAKVGLNDLHGLSKLSGLSISHFSDF